MESLLGDGGAVHIFARRPKPFDDIRVRRAMNLAVNQQEIVDHFYGGHAELMASASNLASTSSLSNTRFRARTFHPRPRGSPAPVGRAGVPEGFLRPTGMLLLAIAYGSGASA